MTWLALTDQRRRLFRSAGLGALPDAAPLVGTDASALLARGSLVVETRMPVSRRPEPLLMFASGGEWPLRLSLQAVPGGGLTLVLDQGGELLHRTINPSDAGRMDVLRFTYSWDSPGRCGRLAVERSDQTQVLIVPVDRPKPIKIVDLRTLFRGGAQQYVSPEVRFLALSTDIEPVGPMPSFLSDTPVATPQGYRAIGDLRRGDLVLTPDGDPVPVLHRLTRTVPAAGDYSPLKLRAPYFGLKADIQVAPHQRLLLAGSDVEYLFGQEAVLVPVRHLLGEASVLPAECGPLVTYTQLLLPEHEPLLAAGTVAESQFIGRLRRKPELLTASVLAGLDRNGLPDHRAPRYPVLRPFEAIVLAEQRAA